MKNPIRVLDIVILCGLLFFLGTQVLFTQEKQDIKPQLLKPQDTTTQETYVSKVLISAPWAKKNLVYNGEESPPGEFGIHEYSFSDSLENQIDAPLPEGPTSFTVAPNDDIYISDPLNYRIQRFSPTGQYISVIPGIKIERYKWNLICVDTNHNVYLLCWEYKGHQIVYKYDQYGRVINTYPFFQEKGRGRGAGSRFYCDKSGGLFFETYKRIKENDYALAVFQIGTDEQVFTPEQQKSTEIITTQGNNKPSKIKNQAWEAAKSKNLWGSEMWNYDFVDDKGDYFLYYSTKDGVTIIKWQKE
jgi:hypothetical protein